MSSTFNSRIDFADKFSDLVVDQSRWSQATFGSDSERGPMGTLKHLEKEARECQEAVGTPEICEELADCLLLLLDASRRAGIKPNQLVEAAQAKMVKNKQRNWPNPQAEWVYEEPHFVDSEDCQGRPIKHWRVFASNPTWINSTTCGTGETQDAALAACKNSVAKKINEPVEHVR